MASQTECLIIGLGVFGKSLAESLKKQQAIVVGVDINEKSLKENQKFLDQIVRADATKEENLRVLGVDNFDYTFVCIGIDMQSNLIATLHLSNLGARRIIARSSSAEHSLILQKLGAHKVVRPEIETGERLSYEIISRFDHFIKFSENLAVVQLEVPEKMWGKNLKEMDLRKKYKINLISIKRNEPFVNSDGEDTVLKDLETVPDPDYRFKKFDKIYLVGDVSNLQRFKEDYLSGDTSAS
ncbi:MAG TPA: potassium transporter Trk [Spirochaetia bacterium]|nr:MAG: hypothetical protein A2Y41_10235 [Spirochaetes bacterium GWB1_36_13]HCL55542.1 potassium transporter Trk [Spirochaetia bacterium]